MASPAKKRYKPRGTVIFYIPADTPKEIIDYLNEIKAENKLSQEIISAISTYMRLKKEGGRQEMPQREMEKEDRLESVGQKQEENRDILTSNNLNAIQVLRQQKNQLVEKRS